MKLKSHSLAAPREKSELENKKEGGKREDFAVKASASTAYLSQSPHITASFRVSQVALEVKNLPVNEEDSKRCEFGPWVGKIPWRRTRQTAPVFFPGESHEQRSLVGSRP